MLTFENYFRTAEGSRKKTIGLERFIPPQYLDFSFDQNQFYSGP